MKLITQEVCLTSDLGVHGNLFGGTMMSWLDKAGAILARKTADSDRMVTIKVSETIFQLPVKVGETIVIYGEVTNIGNTSLSLNLKASKHDNVSGEEKVVCTTSMVFVNIDESGGKRKISKHAKKRFKDGQPSV